MKIRTRLLLLLLPILAALIGLIALFFYYNWSNEILNGFKTRLQSIVTAAAPSISPSEIEWINQNLQDPQLKNNPKYQKDREFLVKLKQELPIDNLYIIRVEPIEEKDLRHLPAEEKTDYKQVFLLDASHPDKRLDNSPGDIDFSETEEHKIYFSKKAYVTPIYKSRKTGERFMSAYAPILNPEGNVIALLGADVSVEGIENKLHNALWIILFSTLTALSLVLGAVYWVANKISHPVHQLNQAALDIAAGNYEANIKVEGPKEITELANTFNTMSECLVENISRLRESSLIRERLYGEYECSLLLQYYMLQKVVEGFSDSHLKMRLNTVNFTNVQKGLLLKIDKSEKETNLTLLEALQTGFEPLYQLNRATEEDEYPYLKCSFQKNYTVLRYQAHLLHPPLVWSVKKEAFVKEENQQFVLHDLDMILLFNSNVSKEWFAKILRHFADDGIDTIQTMLTNELNFLGKRENLKENFQIITLQVS